MKTYEDGLNEAWEVARKIVCIDGYNLSELDGIFERHSTSDILKTNTASEAIDRIKKYNAEHEIVHVGDEIYSEPTNCKAVVQGIDTWHRYQCFTDSGKQLIIDTETFNDYWAKTGKNYPQIAEVIKQMQEGEA